MQTTSHPNPNPPPVTNAPRKNAPASAPNANWQFIMSSWQLILLLALALTTLSLADDETLEDLLRSAPPAATKPAEVTSSTSPSSQPASTLPDALGTMKPQTPAGARIGTLTLNNAHAYEGRIWTTLDTPFRVWIENQKTYRDIDLSLLSRIDVKVLASSLEPDWRWLKEGSDVKVYSGKKYPLVELAYRFTLLNEQIIEGTVVAPIFCFDGNQRHALALYKKYHGPLDETLENVVYIKSITLHKPDPTRAAHQKKTTKLPLLLD